MSIKLHNLTSCIALAAALAFSIGSAANAGAITCTGGASNVSITLTTSVTATCWVFGNGNGVNNSGSDDINAIGGTTLDSNPPTGAGPFTTLAITGVGGTSGTFSFDIPSGFQGFALGFMTTNGVPRPDYFTFLLPGGVNSGDFTINDASGSTSLVRAVIYGVPGPIVGAGLPGLIAAFGALIALARRRRLVV